jgi:hypothetical protein
MKFEAGAGGGAQRRAASRAGKQLPDESNQKRVSN